jgi:hypothetical protein|nr:MAG TPA: capsid fiber protein [Caudoviricetes sp.]
MAIGINELRITPRVGTYVYLPNAPQPHNCIVSDTVTTPLKAGDVLTLDTTSTNPYCPVVKKAAVTDPVYGVLIYDVRTDSYGPNAKTQAAVEGSTVYFEAAGAIQPMAELYFNADGQVTSTPTTGNSIIGIANTYAAAAGDLVQVKLRFAKTAGGS